MKRLYIMVASTITLLATTLTAVALKEASGQLEKITFQTELYPMKVIETNGQTRIMWYQTKNNKADKLFFVK